MTAQLKNEKWRTPKFAIVLVTAILFGGAMALTPAVAQEDDPFDELPPPSFGGSQQNFLDIPDDEFGADGGMEPLALDLPDPYFGGTPLDYKSANLEKPNYKPLPLFMVPAGTANIASGKPVTSSDANPAVGSLAYLVDGDTSFEEASLLELAPGQQWIQIDFGALHTLYALALWHFHEGERVYFDVVIQVSDDEDFTKNVRTVFSNDLDNSSGLGIGKDPEYIESYKSRFVELNGVEARCIRFYSSGNTTDKFNHYVEAQVFGTPVE